MLFCSGDGELHARGPAGCNMRWIFALLLCLFANVLSVGAVEPSTQEAIVLRNKVFDGFEYKDNFVPSGTGHFLLLGDKDNAVAFIQTLEYYWPLSRQVYMAPDRLNISLVGEMRVFRAGRVIQSIKQEQFVVEYPEGVRGGNPALHWGDEARQKATEFAALGRTFASDVARAQADKVRYDAELLASAANRAKGLSANPVRSPLAMPPEPKLLITELSDGYRVNLPPGEYELALFDGDREWVGSRRLLTVLPMTTASLLTLDIVPEERWTRLLPSNTSEDLVFAKPGSTVYVVAQWSDTFDDDVYVRLTSPQLQGVEGKPAWIRRKPAEDVALEYSLDGHNWSSVASGKYAVRQTGGASLGYLIEPVKSGETPDLSAFALVLPKAAETPSIQIRVRDSSSGKLLEDGHRTLYFVRSQSLTVLWVSAFAPILVGALLLVLLWRKAPVSAEVRERKMVDVTAIETSKDSDA
jgi:hypothetical protein